ncbi:MAG: hypothetical protein JNK05_11720 [Myxococcales bacterium]|nr:hypothetical protein [Myxococcales bacterium]
MIPYVSRVFEGEEAVPAPKSHTPKSGERPKDLTEPIASHLTPPRRCLLENCGAQRSSARGEASVGGIALKARKNPAADVCNREAHLTGRHGVAHGPAERFVNDDATVLDYVVHHLAQCPRQRESKPPVKATAFLERALEALSKSCPIKLIDELRPGGNRSNLVFRRRVDIHRVKATCKR